MPSGFLGLPEPDFARKCKFEINHVSLIKNNPRFVILRYNLKIDLAETDKHAQ